MRNEILRIMLKPVPERGLSEELKLLMYWVSPLSMQELKFVLTIKQILKI